MVSNDKRSAGFQPAVSQVSNLRSLGLNRRPADWKSAVQQAESLRYELAAISLGRRSA